MKSRRESIYSYHQKIQPKFNLSIYIYSYIELKIFNETRLGERREKKRDNLYIAVYLFDSFSFPSLSLSSLMFEKD